jgi:pimeloyl-[acyl-carrier protein] methyl ester esterase
MTVENAGVRIRVRTTGTGHPVIMLHGLMATGELWDKQAPRLASDHQLIVPDLRGHGRSDKPADNYSIEDFAADIDSVLRTLNIERADVVGWSMGAVLAMYYAATRPLMVDRLALVSATAMMVTRDGFEHALPADALRPLMHGLATDYPAAARQYAQLVSAPESDASVVDFLTGMAVQSNGASMLTAIAGVGCGDHREAAAKVSAPTLLLHGDRDLAVPLGAGQWVAERIPDAELQVLPGAGHALPLARPDEVTAALRAFLSR